MSTLLQNPLSAVPTDPADLLSVVLAHLSRNAVPTPTGFQCRAIWRGGDGLAVTITPMRDVRGGFVWYDHARGDGGNGQQLAALLGLSAGPGVWTPTPISFGRRAPSAAELVERAAAQELLRRKALTFLTKCSPAHLDPQIASWAESRHLDVDVLARAHVLAPPTRFSGGARLILPVYNASGHLVSYRPRWTQLDAAPADGAKERTLKGELTRPDGSVYACPLARRLLSGDAEAASAVLRCGLVVAEGGPDWLSVIGSYSDADESAPACLGVWSQSVSSVELWQRIPDGIRVWIATHHDEAGHRYAAEITQRLNRRCRWTRSLPGPEGMDLNDTLRNGGPAAVRALLTEGGTWH